MIQHLTELRGRSIKVLYCFGAWFSVFFFFSNSLFHYLVAPLLHVLPNNHGLIATQITAPIFTPIQLAFNLALLISAPYALYQIWRFISPGLYQNEQIPIKNTLLIGLGLFFIGILFCFYVVLPLMFAFLVHSVPKEVAFMPDMTYTLDFITRMLIIFGLCFQVPLVCMLIVRLHIVSIQTLVSIRPYVLVSAFFIGMILTPPDVLSQILLAVPLCVLYELGIILSKYVIKNSSYQPINR